MAAKSLGQNITATEEGDEIVLRIKKDVKLNLTGTQKSWIVAKSAKPARKIAGVSFILTAYTAVEK
jgi:hypothetical protein